MKLKRAKEQDCAEFVLPNRSDAVTIVRPSGERVQARVAECDGEQLLVALMFRADRPLDDGRLSELQLEYTNPRGRIRLRGTVTLVDRELLRFRDLQQPETIQQREYVRVQSSRPVLVVTGGSQGTVQTYSVDISGGGMLLAGPSTLKVGEQVQFRLTTAKGTPPISGVGTIVRADSEGRRALCFDEIAEGEHRRLVRFIFECQRAERRRGLEGGAGGRRLPSRAPRSSEEGGAGGRRLPSRAPRSSEEGGAGGRRLPSRAPRSSEEGGAGGRRLPSQTPRSSEEGGAGGRRLPSQTPRSSEEGGAGGRRLPSRAPRSSEEGGAGGRRLPSQTPRSSEEGGAGGRRLPSQTPRSSEEGGAGGRRLPSQTPRSSEEGGAGGRRLPSRAPRSSEEGGAGGRRLPSQTPRSSDEMSGHGR